MTDFREAVMGDLPHLQNLDLKGYEQQPETMDWWKSVITNPSMTCVVACQNQTPIGMVVWTHQEFQKPSPMSGQTTVHVHKICVQKGFRYRGIGSSLMAKARKETYRLKCKTMSISVPEYQCISDDPDNVSQWLHKLGFKADSVLPVPLHLYGKNYDQYLFLFEVPK